LRFLIIRKQRMYFTVRSNMFQLLRQILKSLSQNLYIKSSTCLTFLFFKLAKNKDPRENICFFLSFVTVDLLLPGPFSVKTKKTSFPSHYRMSPCRLYLLNASLDVFSFFCSFRLNKCLFKGFRNLLFFRTSFGYMVRQ
jgi:hypothetical protein